MLCLLELDWVLLVLVLELLQEEMLWGLPEGLGLGLLALLWLQPGALQAEWLEDSALWAVERQL